LLRTPWTPERTFKEMFLSAFVASTLIGYAITVMDDRYLVPLLPVFLCWTSKGMLEFEDWSAATLSHFGIKPPPPATLRITLLKLMVSALAAAIIASTLRSKWEDIPFEHKEAGLWMKGRLPTSPLIMAGGPWAAYYAGGSHIYLPNAPYQTVLNYARRMGVDYVILGARCLENTGCLQNTPLGFLLDERHAPPDLELLYLDAQRSEYKVLVYRIHCPDNPGGPGTLDLK